MNKIFLNEHPFVSLLMVTVICGTIVRVTRIISNKGKEIHIKKDLNKFPYLLCSEIASINEKVKNKEEAEKKED